jgi:CBS domain containing-hemolysin-like protein
METELLLTGIFVLMLVTLATVKSALDELSDVSLRLLVSEKEGTRDAAFWDGVLEHYQQLVFTLTFGIHVSIAALAILISRLSQQLIPSPFWQAYFWVPALLIMPLAILLFRQVVPLLITQNHPEKAIYAMRVPIRLWWYTLGIVTWPVYRALRKLKKTDQPLTEEHTAEEDAETGLQAFLDVGEEEGIIEEGEGEIIQSIVRLGERSVTEVMTPRPNIVAIEARATLQEVRDLMVQSKYSRLPVYREQLDDIFGVIYVRDLLTYWAEGEPTDEAGKRAGAVARRNLYEIPESKKIAELIQEMRKAKAQMAVVIDEYGGVAGLVTLEDLLEEIVGEIEDEDEPDPLAAEVAIVAEADGGYVVRGQVEIGKIEKEINVELAADDFTTVAGLVINLFGRIPKTGETLDFRGFRFEVLEADERRVSRVRLRAQPTEAAEARLEVTK